MLEGAFPTHKKTLQRLKWLCHF